MSVRDALRTSTWWPVSLRELLSGQRRASPPTVLTRDDGTALWYPGKVHSLAAEPEAGKSWLALHASAQQLAAGRHAVYLDFEDGPETAVERLLALGAHPEAIEERFHFIAPEGALDDEGQVALDVVLDQEPALVTIDGVTEAMGLLGLDLGSNADVARFMAGLVRPIVLAGPATVLLDHVVKSRENRHRYALGAGHKLAAVDVALTLEALTPFGRDRHGKSRLEVVKDRPGHLRAIARGGKLLGEFHLDARDGATEAWVDTPSPEASGPFRPTHLMAKVSDLLEQYPEGLSGAGIESLVHGKAQHIRAAITVLIHERHVTVHSGPRGAKVHKLEEPFNETD